MQEGSDKRAHAHRDRRVKLAAFASIAWTNIISFWQTFFSLAVGRLALHAHKHAGCGLLHEPAIADGVSRAAA